MTRSLIVLSGLGHKLQGLHWESETRLRIGRLDGSVDIVLSCPSISKQHAEVAATRQGWVVRDLGSKCGTAVNGQRLNSGDHLLHPNDVVQCGTMSLQVGFRQAETLPTHPQPTAVVAPPPPPTPTQNGTHIKTTGTYLRVQASRPASWEQALEQVALHPEHQLHQGKHLLTLLRTSHHLTNVASLDALLQAILEDAVKSLDAQRGIIVLMDEITGRLELRAVYAPKCPQHNARHYSKTLADRCYRLGESLLCSDVNLDADLQAANSVKRGAMASITCALLRSPRQKLGVLHLDRSPYQEPFSTEEFYLADAVAASVSVGIESAQLVEEQRNQFIQTITALARTVEIRDEYTAHHTERVTDYSLLLAEQLGMTPMERQQIKVGTPLHDIGKIGIDDAILRKPGKLTHDEFEAMKLHTLKGAAILESIPALGPMIPIVRNHHERWDGQGYPDGLAMDSISRLARVVAVADAFDAMTSHRPYRKAMPVDQAFAELMAKAGTHFDPACVKAFLALRSKIEPLPS